MEEVRRVERVKVLRSRKRKERHIEIIVKTKSMEDVKVIQRVIQKAARKERAANENDFSYEIIGIISEF